MFKLKTGVSIQALTSQMVLAVTAVHSVYDSLGYDCVLTSGDDGLHGEKSLHYAGNACDFRTRCIPKEEHEHLTELIRDVLSVDFDVVLEETHIHVEYQPRGGR